MTAALTQSRALSRRSFLVAVGATGAIVTFGPAEAFAAAGATAQPFAANAWISIAHDGTVTIMSPAAEMGQGVMTSLPLIIADEMDADWHKVKVVQSPSDGKTFGNPAQQGFLMTHGSQSVTGYWDKLRPIGAQTRKVLCWNAAQMMNVPVSELTTEPGFVVHKGTKKRLSYGEIARHAKLPDPMPEAGKDDLKKPADYRYLGKNFQRVDIPHKVNGSAAYGLDVNLPGMLYASVLHPPVQGEIAEKIDDSAAKAVKGVKAVVPLPIPLGPLGAAGGVAVVGETYEATKKAKALLQVTWSNKAAGRTYDTETVGQEYAKTAADWSQKGVDMVAFGLSHGDAAAANAGAARVIKADFVSEHVAHTCMEPLNATVRVDGDKVEVWAGQQSPSIVQFICAAVGKTSPANVAVHSTFIGGGFGRRDDGPEVAEALLLAKGMPGTPIKVIWSREDDITNDTFRPLVAQHFEIGLDQNNDIVGWRHRIVGASYAARALAEIFEKMGGQDIVTAGLGAELNYKLPAHTIDYVRAEGGVSVGAWRSIAAGYAKFAQEQLIDEIAAIKNVDPVEFRLKLLQEQPRAKHVIETVAKMAGWGKKRPNGRALGFAYSDCLRGHHALAAECSVDRASGRIHVHEIWAATNPGFVIDPKNTEQQMESAIIMGLGAGLVEHVDIKKGVVQQQNFDTYRLMRMSDVPPMHIAVISTEDHPTGVGEAGTPPVAPAIANAVAVLTGKRLRHLPMTPTRVQEVLKA
ncbi:MAG TPA: molybdopterin cofactor-binding domain-containing protein [Stellaceae bacterium]|nr:molybdopterin cofactor-binding domain-containing protein [Stellaceae bacterium]